MEKERNWTALGPVESSDHSNYCLFSSQMVGVIVSQSLGTQTAPHFLWDSIPLHSLRLLHIKHFLQLFLRHSYLYYLTPSPIQSDCSFRPTLVWLESIPGSFQDRQNDHVCTSVCGWGGVFTPCVTVLCVTEHKSKIEKNVRPVVRGQNPLKVACKWVFVPVRQVWSVCLV